MQGRIYDWNGASGVVLDGDGHRYWFDAPDWQGSAAPAMGQLVGFAGDEATDKASLVTPLSQASPEDSSDTRRPRMETLVMIGVAVTVFALTGLLLVWWASR